MVKTTAVVKLTRQGLRRLFCDNGYLTRCVVNSLCSVGMGHSAKNVAGNGVESRGRRLGTLGRCLKILIQDV